MVKFIVYVFILVFNNINTNKETDLLLYRINHLLKSGVCARARVRVCVYARVRERVCALLRKLTG